MNKNILIGFLVLIIGILLYLQLTPKDNSIATLTIPDIQENTQVKKPAVYNFNNTKISYDASTWKPIDNRYCTPAQGQDGKKYDGSPCDLIGFTFQYLGPGATSDDVISMGGWQPMACDVILKKTKCSDTYAMVTTSNNKEVLNFYDYLINLMP